MARELEGQKGQTSSPEVNAALCLKEAPPEPAGLEEEEGVRGKRAGAPLQKEPLEVSHYPALPKEEENRLFWSGSRKESL